jgi:hypothetical protein
VSRAAVTSAKTRWVVERTIAGCNTSGTCAFDSNVSASFTSVHEDRSLALVHGGRRERTSLFNMDSYVVAASRRTERGRAAASMRLTTATPIAASVCCAAGSRERALLNKEKIEQSTLVLAAS